MRPMRLVLSAGSCALLLGLALPAMPASAACDGALVPVGCTDPGPPGTSPSVPLLTPPADPQPAPAPDPQPQPAPAPAPAADTDPAPSVPSEADGASELADLINRDRLAQHLAPLRVVAALGEVATGHSREMAAKGEIWHNDALFRPDTKQRLQAVTIGENVAQNGTIADAHRRLMASPGHRANLLSPRFGTLGIGLARAGGSWFVTEVFVEPRAVAAPAVPRPAATKAGVAVAAHAAPAVPPAAAAPRIAVGAGQLADTMSDSVAGVRTATVALARQGRGHHRRLPTPVVAAAFALLVGVTLAAARRISFRFRMFCPIPTVFARTRPEARWTASSSSTTTVSSGR